MVVKHSVAITAYLCLGSNIQPRRNLACAVNRIQQDFINTKISSIYCTSAVGFDGDDFLNLAIEIETEFSLKELLVYADQLEQMAGRVRVKRGNFDARTLDVDILVYDDLVGMYEGRMWPSQDLGEYGHVLMPLAEIAGHARDPSSGRSFQQLWDQFEYKQQFEQSAQRLDISMLGSGAN